MTHAPFHGDTQSDYRLLHPEKERGKLILTLRTDRPEAELGLYESKGPLSYEELAYVKWKAHLKLTETIHKKIEEVLDRSSNSIGDIEGIVCFKGPGSFTGLRIGLSVSNALAYSYQIPIVATRGKDWLPKGIKLLNSHKNEKIALPEYDKPAATSKPRK